MKRLPDSSTLPPYTGTVVILDDGLLVGPAEKIDFVGDGVSVVISGAYAFVDIPSGAGPGAAGLGFFALDDGVPIGTGTSVDFGAGLSVSISGTRLQVDATGQGTLTVLSGTFQVRELLYEETVVSPTGSLVFAPIPQGYDHLEMTLLMRCSTGTNQDLQIFLNGDNTAADYRRIAHIALDGTHNIFSADDSAIGSVLGPGALANAYSYAAIELPYYSVTGVHHQMRSIVSERRAAASEMLGTWFTQWELLAAVTSLRLAPAAGLVASGTALRVYGVGHRTLITSVG